MSARKRKQRKDTEAELTLIGLDAVSGTIAMLKKLPAEELKDLTWGLSAGRLEPFYFSDWKGHRVEFTL